MSLARCSSLAPRVRVARAPAARAAEVSVVKDEPGFGSKTAKPGDLLLVNYVATLPDGTMVDTTRGGAKYFTNGNNQSIQPAEARRHSPTKTVVTRPRREVRLKP